ncbi:MAG: hypothetical protein HDT40_05405 [Lachnospiraceae bacterium]|nr:hypothetical protein [Lachnospiraceae bacterium]
MKKKFKKIIRKMNGMALLGIISAAAIYMILIFQFSSDNKFTIILTIFVVPLLLEMFKNAFNRLLDNKIANIDIVLNNTIENGEEFWSLTYSDYNIMSYIKIKNTGKVDWLRYYIIIKSEQKISRYVINEKLLCGQSSFIGVLQGIESIQEVEVDACIPYEIAAKKFYSQKVFYKNTAIFSYSEEIAEKKSEYKNNNEESFNKLCRNIKNA